MPKKASAATVNGISIANRTKRILYVRHSLGMDEPDGILISASESRLELTLNTASTIYLGAWEVGRGMLSRYESSDVDEGDNVDCTRWKRRRSGDAGHDEEDWILCFGKCKSNQAHSCRRRACSSSRRRLRILSGGATGGAKAE